MSLPARTILVATYFPRSIKMEGVGSLVIGLSAQLAREGWRVRLLVPKGDYEPIAGVEFSQYSPGLGSLRRYRRAIREHSLVDVVLLVENNPVMAKSAEFSSCANNTFLLFYTPYQRLNVFRQLGLGRQALIHAVMKNRFWARHHNWPAYRCIVSSQYQYRQLRSLGATEVHVIPACGLSGDAPVPTRSQARKVLGWDGQPVVGYLGHFSAAKGVDYLIEGFANYRGPAVLALDHSGRGALGRRAKRLLEDLVRQGRARYTVRSGDAITFLAACDLVALPYITSSNHHQPQVLIESFAAGTAVLTTSVGGFGEVVRNGQTGFLVDPGNALAVTRGIAEAMKDLPALHETGRAAQMEFRQQHCSQVFVKGLSSLLAPAGEGIISTRYDYRSKYTQAGILDRRVLTRYFGTLSEMLVPLGLGSALEIGCGEGFSTQRLREMLPPSVALEAGDVEDRLIREARNRNPNVPVRMESVYELPRQDKSVDLVLLLEVLEHLDDPIKALKEACRVSRKYVVVGVPKEPLWRLLNLARLRYLGSLGNTPGHIQHWSPRGICKFVQSCADVRIVRKPFPWTIVLAEVR